MLQLAAALLAGQSPIGQVLQGIGRVAVRRVPAHFEMFEREVLCMAVAPHRGAPGMLMAVEDEQVIERHRTCRLAHVRGELLEWVLGLAGIKDMAMARRIEAAFLGELLVDAGSQCTYRLAPSILPDARPIVLIDQSALDAYGRERMLKALWESIVAAGAAAEREFGALYDESLERARDSAARRKAMKETAA